MEKGQNMIKVNSVEASENSLAEAQKRIAKLMEKRNGKEYDFNERLQDACTEVWARNQEAREKIAETRKVAEEELAIIRDNLVCGYH